MPLGARSPAAQAESLPLYRWLLDRRAECRMAVERVPLSGLEGWTADPATGEIRHARGGFFSVVGIRVTDASGREVSAWSQPILEQSEPGVLGLVVRTGPDGDEYLVGAKPEPGHPEKVLLGPTLQATLSNLKGLHGGRGTPMADHFAKPRAEDVLFAVLQAEPGGRFLHKSNLHVVLRAPASLRRPAPAPEGWRWATLADLKALLRIENAVNPYLRSLMACL